MSEMDDLRARIERAEAERDQMKAMEDALMALYEEDPRAVNYQEVTIVRTLDGKAEVEFVLTIQRKEGVTPGNKAAMATARAEKAEAERDELKAELARTPRDVLECAELHQSNSLRAALEKAEAERDEALRKAALYREQCDEMTSRAAKFIEGAHRVVMRGHAEQCTSVDHGDACDCGFNELREALKAGVR